MLFPAPQHKADEVPSDAELARFIPGNAIAAGRAYAQAGRVLRMSVSDDGNRIEAETQGSRRTPYAETIVLRRDPQGHLRIIGLCSCAVHTNCKHVAAVLIVARGRHKLAPAPAGQGSAISPRPAPGPAGSPQPQARPAPVPPREEPLPYPLANWLLELEAAQQADEEDYPPSIRQRLFYVLDKAPQPRGIPALTVQPVSVQLRKNGEISAAQRNFPPESVHGQQPARFLRPSDRIILRRLARRRHGNDEDEDPQNTVRRIIATGRARWGSVTGPVANEGPPRPGRIAWVVHEDGSQQPEVALDAPGSTLLRVPEPWYAEAATGTLGPVALDLPAPVARRLLTAPAIPPDQAARVRRELARRMPSLAVPAPDELPPPEGTERKATRPSAAAHRLAAAAARHGAVWQWHRHPAGAAELRLRPVRHWRGRTPDHDGARWPIVSPGAAARRRGGAGATARRIWVRPGRPHRTELVCQPLGRRPDAAGRPGRLRLAARAAARPAGAARRGLDDRHRRRLPDTPRRTGRRPVRRTGRRLRHRLAGTASRRDGRRAARGPGALAGGDDRRVGGIRIWAAGPAERGGRRRAVPGAAAGRPFPAAAAAAHPSDPAGADGTVRARGYRSRGRVDPLHPARRGGDRGAGGGHRRRLAGRRVTPGAGPAIARGRRRDTERLGAGVLSSGPCGPTRHKG